MSTSVAAVTNHFPDAENGFTTTLAATIAGGATTVPLNSVAGYTNGQPAVFVVDPSDAVKKQTFTGIVDTAGVQLTSVVWTAGTNQTHSGGATVVDYATATHIAMMTKGLLVEHTQAGVHTLTSNSTITSSKVITSLNDTNGNELVKVTPTTSAVNEITLANAAAGGSPVISASGNDTNIGLTFTPKGTGKPAGFANFFIGEIAAATLGTTGNKAITGVGFTPKLVRFLVITPAAVTAAVYGMGSMTAQAQFFSTSYASGTNLRRTGSTVNCIGWTDNTSSQLICTYLSMDADGFTITVNTASSTFAVAYEAYG